MTIHGPVTIREHADRVATWHGLQPLAILHTQRHLADPERGDGHDADGIAGDCARAAIATILGCGWAKVPHAAHYPPGYDSDIDPLVADHGGLFHRRLRRWLRAERGLDVGWWDWAPASRVRARPRFYKSDEWSSRSPWSGWVLASGPSPRGPFDHLVVAAYHWRPSHRGGGRLVPELTIAHDPHPSRVGLASATSIGLLLDPYDPPPPALDDEAPGVVAAEVSA